MRSAIKEAIHLSLVVGMFGYFGAGAMVSSRVVLPLALRGLVGREARTRRAHAVTAKSFRRFHGLARALGLIDFDPAEGGVTPPNTPCVVIANHPTLIDVTAIWATIESACTVVRRGLFDNPFVGGVLRACWHIDGGSGETVGGSSVVDGAIERINAGFNVLIFPEGTRSPIGGVRRFRRGAFEVACRANVPIVMLFVTCSPPTLMKGAKLPRRASRMTVEPAGVLRPEDFAHDARRMARHAQAMYQARVADWWAAHPEGNAPVDESLVNTASKANA